MRLRRARGSFRVRVTFRPAPTRARVQSNPHPDHHSQEHIIMGDPKVPSSTGDAKIDRQGHTSNGMHGDWGRATNTKRGNPTPETIQTKRG